MTMMLSTSTSSMGEEPFTFMFSITVSYLASWDGMSDPKACGVLSVDQWLKLVAPIRPGTTGSTFR